MWPQCLPPSLGSIWLRVKEQMWFQDFQDGHLRTILFLFVLHVCVCVFKKNNPYTILGQQNTWTACTSTQSNQGLCHLDCEDPDQIVQIHRLNSAFAVLTWWHRGHSLMLCCAVGEQFSHAEITFTTTRQGFLCTQKCKSIENCSFWIPLSKDDCPGQNDCRCFAQLNTALVYACMNFWTGN